MDSIVAMFALAWLITALVLVFLLGRDAYEQGVLHTVKPSEFWGRWVRFSVGMGIAQIALIIPNFSEISDPVRLFGAVLGAVLSFPFITISCLIPWAVGRIRRTRRTD